MSKGISVFTGPIFTIFSPNGRYLRELSPPVQFFRFLKGRCHGNQFCGKIVEKLPTHPALIDLSFRNGMGHHYLNVRINSVNDAAKSCKNFVNFGPATPEKTGLIYLHFVQHGKKLAYLVKYLRIDWTNFYDLFTI